eukprot:scaffold64903_cov28-Tisochrysis_lutea.AAC.5
MHKAQFETNYCCAPYFVSVVDERTGEWLVMGRWSGEKGGRHDPHPAIFSDTLKLRATRVKHEAKW